MWISFIIQYWSWEILRDGGVTAASRDLYDRRYRVGGVARCHAWDARNKPRPRIIAMACIKHWLFVCGHKGVLPWH